jgi:acyl-CoA synthetase (AMP-forming)/AMP-acid ligase II
MSVNDLFHDAATIQAHTASGVWPNRTLDDYLRQHARERGDKLVLVDRKWRLTFAELDRLTQRVACGVYQHGIRPGDVISIQLPNWAEWLILHCAATRIGAVTNSIGAIYRQHEVEYILRSAESALILIPDNYRGFDHAGMINEIRPHLPHLQHVLVVGSEIPDGMNSFSEFLETPWEQEVPTETIEELRPDPNKVTTLMFTSGTTAQPKGVMHTHNTMTAGTIQCNEVYSFTQDDAIFMASPIGHTTALLIGARLPVQYGMTAVWQQHWDAAEAIDLIAQDRCTFTLSATPFLHGLINAPNASRENLKSLKTFACGGAPIPRQLIRQAEEEFGLFVSAVYGSSEALINTAIYPGTPLERRFGSDGRLLNDVEARLVDPESGMPAAPGEEGELLIRTPAQHAGYYRDPETTRQVCLDEGWYATGDLCTLEEDGYLTVVGRKKDMIIRGGANISAREIEEFLFTHPKIENVACVAMPDPVLAERVCAYVICTPGEKLSFEEMVQFLKAKRISNWKLPERLEIREEFPMTPSGKVQKFLLREEIARLVGET